MADLPNSAVRRDPCGGRPAMTVPTAIVAFYPRYIDQGPLLPDLAAALVRLPVDVIVAAGSDAALAARHATSTIPIVAAGIADTLTV